MENSLTAEAFLAGSSDFDIFSEIQYTSCAIEILRLVYKREFFKVLNGSILLDLLSFEKSSNAPYRSCKKNFFKIFT